MGYWIGGGLIVAAIAGAILFGVVSGANLLSTVDDFERVAAGERRTVNLDDRKYIIYREGNSAEFAAQLPVEIIDAESGEAVDIGGYSTSLTYDFGDHNGSAQGTLTPPRAGSYRVRVSADPQSPDAGIALGESISTPLLRTILGTLAIGGVLGIAGIALIIVTGIRRSRARSRAAH